MKFSLPALALLGLSLAVLPACKNQQATLVDTFPEDVNKPLEPGEFGLTKLDPKDFPDMRAAFMDRANLERAIDKSIQYMSTPSSLRMFPSGPNDPITHAQVLASLKDFKGMLHSVQTADQFQQNIVSRYDVWTSKGYNRKGDVWFTGYYTPIYHGSKTPTAEYRYPIYARPDDLVSDPLTGEVMGQRQANGTVLPYPTRRELMTTKHNLIAGKELLWFKDPLEPYVIQVQGSAKVILPDGQAMMIGYAGKNGRDYKGLGQQLLEAGKLDPKHLSLPAVLAYFQAHPGEREAYILNNDSFAFLKEYDPAEWPSGSLGVQVTAGRSLATDKKIFPRAAMTFITVDRPAADGVTMVPYRGFLLDQDTGGAIRAAGRADIYLGIGDEAGRQAGRQFAQGRLYYLFLKPGQYAESAAFPDLKGPAKSGGTAPKAGGTAPKTGGTAPKTGGSAIPPGGDEMFPGAKKK